MTAVQALYGVLLVIAIMCALATPGSERGDVLRSARIVSVSWVLCFWSVQSFTDLTPTQLIYDSVHIVFPPLRIWAVQDAVFSCLLAGIWVMRRSGVVLGVGLVFMVQIVCHVEYQAFFHNYKVYSGVLDTLFLVQLGLISTAGGDRLVRDIRDRIARYRRDRMARRGRGAIHAAKSSRGGISHAFRGRKNSHG